MAHKIKKSLRTTAHKKRFFSKIFAFTAHELFKEFAFTAHKKLALRRTNFLGKLALRRTNIWLYGAPIFAHCGAQKSPLRPHV
jgi:hypothetical protein